MRAAWVRDLNQGATAVPVETDVCILGAGPVGLTVARALLERGHRVTVLEIGDTNPQLAVDSTDVRFDRRIYRGASLGRAFGLGGTSAHWGGQLLPVRPADLLARPAVRVPAWPLTYDDLSGYFDALQDLLGVEATAFDLTSARHSAPALTSLDFTDWAPRLSKWLPFGRRNLATSWLRQFDRHPEFEVWLNAETMDWTVERSADLARVRRLVARSPNGHRLEVHPRTVIIAAGALESARVVLEIDDRYGPLSAGVSAYAGRFLHDHLSLRIARATIVDLPGFQRCFAPFFERSVMRSLRMELAPEVLQDSALPALYAHFVVQAAEESGFAVLRDLLRAAQRRDFRTAWQAAARVPGALPDIATILYSRFVRRRLAFPSGSTVFLHVDFEQAPTIDCRILLDTAAGSGRRPVRIDWDVGVDAAGVAASVREHFERFWRRNNLDRFARLEFIEFQEAGASAYTNMYDIYHPAGTTVMHPDPSQGVVDRDLRLHGTDNAYVVGTSVFPSMGAANPTFTAMALALRLADFIHHGRDARSGG